MQKSKTATLQARDEQEAISEDEQDLELQGRLQALKG
jgi:hypothetical protein